MVPQLGSSSLSSCFVAEGEGGPWLVSFVYVWFNTARTLQLIRLELEVLQVREVADGRRDGACARAREFLCMSGHTQIGSESANVPDRALKLRMS